MLFDYTLDQTSSVDKTSDEAVIRAAGYLGVATHPDPGGHPRVDDDGLTIYGVEPDDESRRFIRQTLGFSHNVIVVLSDSSHGDEAMLLRVMERIIDVTVRLTAAAGTTAVLSSDYVDDELILRVEGGDIVLNEAWEGWQLWPHLVTRLPASRRFGALRAQGQENRP